MTISCSPSGIVNFERPGQGINDLSNSGFENISLDINMCCSGAEYENFGNIKRESLKILLDKCREKNLKISITRVPFILKDTKQTDLAGLHRRITEESIRLCREADCRYIVIPPLYYEAAREETWQKNHDYYIQLAEIAVDCNVMILLENQCHNMNGHLIRGIGSDGSTAAKWIDSLNEEVGREIFGFCMNASVCNLCGQNMHEFALELGSRIKAVILSDCDGHNKAAMLPFTCVQQGQSQTDWLSLIRGLRENGFDGQIILDIADTASVFSPLLRPQLLILAKYVAEYFKWQIEIENLLKKYKTIVLFGAGNMCRNYMKCYGEKYPPLFTCDNNKALWGTSFCGLEVRSPEALKELPSGCGIFICNIYYREIEKQLKNMGIKNIEFFNDEYMPSFYFDRLKGV